MTTPRRRGGEAASGSARPGRRRRARPTPKWLRQAQDLDQIGKARCLLVLDVLSGRTPVTDAIQAGKLSRGTYYQLETRALQAMLTALTPGVVTESGAADRVATTRRLATLEGQVRRLEQGKRRAERLLVLTRKVIQPGRLTTAGPKPGRPRSTRAGADASRRPARGRTTSPSLSTPTPGGGGGC
jgi:hypothetical protein